jgi:hypothetical protein
MTAVLYCALLCWVVAPASALGQTILDASYDASSDAIVVEIAYQGTNPNHDFELSWDQCQKAANGGQTVVARLIDQQGKDTAQNDYRVRRRFDVSALGCRPAEVTLRLGPVSNRTVSVPAARR